MPTHPHKKVRPGDPLRISAPYHNEVVDLLRSNAERQHEALSRATPRRASNTLMLVQNDSGADRDWLEVLGIDDVLISPAEELDEWRSRFILTGVTPATADHSGLFVVLAEPIPDGDCGMAYLAGVCPVKIDVTDADHACADVTDGDASKLTSCAAGAARILWRQTGTGEKWAVVRIDGGAGVPAGSANYDLLYWDATAGEWKVLSFGNNNWEVLLRNGSGELAWGDPRWV